MSSRDSLDLDEIIELIHGKCPYPKPCPVVNQGKQAIVQWALDEVIGADEDPTYSEDETVVPRHPDDQSRVLSRNDLRAEQRLRLKGDIDEQ